MFEEIKVRNNINMSDEELYSFYNRYSFDELELFKIKFDFVKESTENKEIFERVYLEKKAEKKVNHNDDRIITEKMIDKNSSLSNKELNYLYGFTTSIPSYFIEGLENLNISIYKEIEKRLYRKFADPVASMTNEELVDYFNKYDLNELEAFQILFTYSKDYDLTDAFSIIRKIYDNKADRMNEEDYYIYRSVNRFFDNRVIVLRDRVGELENKELRFLRTLVQNSRKNLSDAENAFVRDIKDLNDLSKSINEELKSRKKVYKLKPIK